MEGGDALRIEADPCLLGVRVVDIDGRRLGRLVAAYCTADPYMVAWVVVRLPGLRRHWRAVPAREAGWGDDTQTNLRVAHRRVQVLSSPAVDEDSLDTALGRARVARFYAAAGGDGPIPSVLDPLAPLSGSDPTPAGIRQPVSSPTAAHQFRRSHRIGRPRPVACVLAAALLAVAVLVGVALATRPGFRTHTGADVWACLREHEPGTSNGVADMPSLAGCLIRKPTLRDDPLETAGGAALIVLVILEIRYLTRHRRIPRPTRKTSQ